MNRISTVKSIQDEVFALKKQGKKIGLIPTMGALHEGHLSLVEQARQQCDVIIVSIFVNPTQFNNPSDLANYPRTIEKDMDLLSGHGVMFVFAPSVEEIYPSDYVKPAIDLGALGLVMEGKFRPGHFQGVIEVVKRLLESVQPDAAYFGQKDFQQLAVIHYMVNYFKIPVAIVECPIVRSDRGLALSSRNMRLSEAEKEQALVIYTTLLFVKAHVADASPEALMKQAVERINAAGLKTEYVEIVHPLTLETLTDKWIPGAVCCVAAYCGEVRLIDNMLVG
ncbi:pantoate--beta-alanine ligase [Crocinitomicaceae bacterium CZZ-1]|uniref:Pantothenate synthetase n=1 Tax=Taishania pollutisoli TaxID=2766479 RepID=A0A8J6PIY2_9FLAO|nr:pantoate--beta-alanine ligase [Taishania pollutisoli]MBC9812501.1 pantoate--beta-alanine ligase [Taishania pollutisoli]